MPKTRKAISTPPKVRAMFANHPDVLDDAFERIPQAADAFLLALHLERRARTLPADSTERDALSLRALCRVAEACLLLTNDAEVMHYFGPHITAWLIVWLEVAAGTDPADLPPLRVHKLLPGQQAEVIWRDGRPFFGGYHSIQEQRALRPYEEWLTSYLSGKTIIGRPAGTGHIASSGEFRATFDPIVRKIRASGRHPSQESVVAQLPWRLTTRQLRQWCGDILGLTWGQYLESVSGDD